MEPLEQQLFARALQGYERARLRQALFAALPTVLFPLVAFALGGRLPSSVGLGVGLLAVVVALGWRGEAWGQAVPAGLKAGVFPLAFALAAQRIGHSCTPDGCTSLCVPLCTVGGVIAGGTLAFAARNSPARWLTLAGGAGVSVLIGAMGCSCVGRAGMLAMGTSVLLSAAIASGVSGALKRSLR